MADARWKNLIQWLASHGMVVHDLRVEVRSSPGAGYGLFASQTIQPSTPLFSIPASALVNHITLEPHYPATRPKLSCTQIVSMHLMLHKPANQNSPSGDPLFGPYISILPVEMHSHPLTWLWKENVHGSGTIESKLLDILPKSVMEMLNRSFGLFQMDWGRIKDYLKENPRVVRRRTRNANHAKTLKDWECDYLWAWLIVNTRCIYHRLAQSRSHPNNQTLCPILDFANHTYGDTSMYPQPTQAETLPSSKQKFGNNFVLFSPSTATVMAGEQLFLRYGMHANSTLFTEYGFVNIVNWRTLPESFSTAIEIDSDLETLFEQRGELGSYMKNILLNEGYWGDWVIQIMPAPAHPSYRLITALRLYHILPAEDKNIPLDLIESLVDEWRNTTLGKRDVISEGNECLWRMTLASLCEEMIAMAAEGQSKTARVVSNDSIDWLDVVKKFIETLWEEQNHVAKEVSKSLKARVDF